MFYSVLPKRWALPITHACMALVMLAFWTLFRTKPAWGDARLMGGAHEPIRQSRCQAATRYVGSAEGSAISRAKDTRDGTGYAALDVLKGQNWRK
jgi:hypothetical protein